MTGPIQHDALRRAQAAGTLNALDRSKQYEHADNRELLRAVNEAWAKIRAGEKSNTEKDAKILALENRIGRYKVANIALTSIITGLAWEGVKFLIQHFTR